MSSTKTLQFFLNELLSKLDEKSMTEISAGNVEAVLTLTKPMSAIDPTDGGHRDAVARFRGSLADRLAIQNRSFNAWAIPAGTALVQAVGANGVTVAGNSVFLAVPTSVLVKENDLGVGSSAEIRDRFTAWEQGQA